jgi:ubiquinone biosynthesis protein
MAGRTTRRPGGPTSLIVFLVQVVGRALRVAALALVYLPAVAVLRFRSDPRDAVVLRSFLERAGGGFVKLGQLLAMRYDYLPERYCMELSKLLDRLPAISFDQIRKTIDVELGDPASDRFRLINERPLATASLAQVHAGELADGTLVAIKVLKPGIRRVMSTDLALAQIGMAILLAWPGVARSGLRAVVREIRRQADRELDFELEARTASRFHELLASDQVRHSAPFVVRDLCSPSVLTMELIEGRTVTSMLDDVASGPTIDPDAAHAAVEARRHAAILIFHSILAQTMVHRMFNADPHASNIIVRPDGSLAWVDFGLAGWIDERQWRRELLEREAFATGDLHRMYTVALDALAPLPGGDLRSFEHAWKSAAADYRLAVTDPLAPIAARSFARFLRSSVASMRAVGLRLDASSLQLYRAIVISDIVILRLYPDIDWLSHLRAFLRRESARLLLRAPRRPMATALALASMGELGIDAINWATDEWPMQRQPINVRTHGPASESILALLHVSSAAVALGALAVGVASVGSAPAWMGIAVAAAVMAISIGFVRSGD